MTDHHASVKQSGGSPTFRLFGVTTTEGAPDLPRVSSLLTAVLNAVISSLSFKSRRLPGVSLVHPTRSRCIRVGLTSASFERDESPVAFLSELHAAVFHCLEPRG
jgi:hypothetical protein